MGFERFIAWKHLTRRKRTGFISLISLISIGGVSVGVMALIVVLGVMSGFDRELKQKIVNVQPHLRIDKYGGLEQPYLEMEKIKELQFSGLRSVAPFIEGQAILKSDVNATGVVVKGIDPLYEEMQSYQKGRVAGTMDLGDETFTVNKRKMIFFRESREITKGGILLGAGLARNLKVHIGDEVQLISPFQNQKGISLTKQAESHTFIVNGIFKLGMNDFDQGLALIHLNQAQKIYHLGSKVTGIGVRFFDVDDAQKWKPMIGMRFGYEYLIRSWYDLNQNFFQALKVEKSVMTILLGLIIMVAAFNIISTLVMVVMEKTMDIGILRALGATRGAVRNIFIYQGFTVGLIGVASGAIMGLLVAFNLNPIADFIKETTGLEVFPSDIYYFDEIPVLVHPEDVLLIVGFALLSSMIAGILPANRASKLNPLDALRAA